MSIYILRSLALSGAIVLTTISFAPVPAMADSYLGLGGGSGPRLEFRFGNENRRIERRERGDRHGPGDMRFERGSDGGDREFGDRRRERGGDWPNRRRER